MKNSIIILLGVTTILLAVTTFVYFIETKIQTKVIANRELTITNYQKVIKAIGRSGGISINELKMELKAEFNMDGIIEYNDYNKEYCFVLYPRTNKINHKEIWQFTGLSLILDEYKKIKTVSIYKP